MRSTLAATCGSNRHYLAPKSVRPAQAAELLGVCRDTVYVLMRSGQLRSKKAGRARLIPLTAIEDFLNSDEEVTV